MGLKPYVTAPSVFEGGELRKFNSSGLNRSRTFSGGGSGHRSEARRQPIGDGKYQFKGVLLPDRVVKTTIHYTNRETFEAEVNGETVVGVNTTVKRVSQPIFIPIKQAFNLIPFTTKVVYTYGSKDQIGEAETITVTNVNIR